MIEESYVSFDTAKLLKEAGFREHCRCMYFPNKDGSHKICQNIIADYDVTNDDKYKEGDYYGYGDCYLAPTQALAARWLREVHEIDVVVNIYNRDYYMCNVYKKRLMIIKSIESSFEEAFEVGLREAIKLIKK